MSGADWAGPDAEETRLLLLAHHGECAAARAAAVTEVCGRIGAFAADDGPASAVGGDDAGGDHAGGDDAGGDGGADAELLAITLDAARGRLDGLVPVSLEQFLGASTS
jgi:hypothetical protein